MSRKSRIVMAERPPKLNGNPTISLSSWHKKGTGTILRVEVTGCHESCDINLDMTQANRMSDWLLKLLAEQPAVGLTG